MKYLFYLIFQTFLYTFCFFISKKFSLSLWISGLCPLAYWIGQSLVDIPLYCLILLSIYLINYFMILELMFALLSDHFFSPGQI